MTDASPHAWLRPKLAALVAEAEAAGIARDVSVAVITDLINGLLSADTPQPSAADPNQDIGEPNSAANAGAPYYSTPDEPMENIGTGQPHLGRHRWR